MPSCPDMFTIYARCTEASRAIYRSNYGSRENFEVQTGRHSRIRPGSIIPIPQISTIFRDIYQAGKRKQIKEMKSLASHAAPHPTAH